MVPENLHDFFLSSASVAGALIGLLFVAASLLSLVRLHEVRWSTVRDGLFLIGLFVVFLVQLIEGADLLAHPADSGSVDTIAIMVIVCFLIGVARAWELIGGPSIGIREEVTALVRNHDKAAEGSGEEELETRSTA